MVFVLFVVVALIVHLIGLLVGRHCASRQVSHLEDQTLERHSIHRITIHVMDIYGLVGG